MEACESVYKLTVVMESGIARIAVHIATSSALVDDGQSVEAHTKEIFNDGMIQPEPIIGSSSVV